jgi:crotonobetaine/carnitine-CoA ligase
MVPSELAERGRDTLVSVLRSHATRQPDAPFLVFEREPGNVETTSYAEMVARVRRTAGALARHGVGPGTRFHVHLSNRPDFYDVWLAAGWLGAAIVPSNPLSTADELHHFISHGGCQVSVTQSDLRATVEKAGIDVVLDVDEPWVHDADEAAAVDVAPTEPLAVLYTSGTTSRPKGVLISHAAYLHVGDVVANHVRLRPDDRTLIVLPLFHGNAQYYSTMSALVTGASIALTPRFSASRFSEQAHVLEATVASLFAAPIRMILAQEPTEHDAAHRLRVTLFAQNITDAQVEEFERRFATPLVQLYGMTETVVPPTINPMYEPRRADAIGRPVTGARVRLIDGDGADVPVGETGELVVQGEPGRTMMSAYLNDLDATAATLRDGWLHTGDSVRADEDGFLYFVDRRKDMIKRAGENVSTVEVERVINEHPAVFESAAVGVPDPIRDEALHVFVVLHPGASVSEEDLLAYCRERMAKFKVPDAIEIVDDLPRTSVGKIQKHILRSTLT